MDLLTAADRIGALAAPQGPGFFRLNDSKTKQYACYWVNDDNRIALISKNYSTARSRNKMQQRLENGDYRAEPIKFKDRFGYKVVNGGNKIVAAGPLFDSQRERDQQLRSLPAALLPLDATPNTPASKPVSREAGQRHSFRLNFYASESGDKWQGRISYPLTEAKKSFQDVDLDVIGSFIRSILKQADTDETRSQVAKKLSPEPEAQQLRIVYQGRPLKGGALNVGETVNLSIQLQDSDEERDYQVHVFAKSLPTGQRTTLNDFVAHTTTDQQLEVPIATDNLEAGLYRFNAEVTPAGLESDEAEVTRASSLIQFI